jgi:ubiquinone/menaquinone biosynthesis C-methylase UbiE
MKVIIKNEALAAVAFSTQSAVFDQLYAQDAIINYKRFRVRAHIEKYLPPRSNMLELNSGTGEDAIYFAKKGHTVHATDIAIGMQEKLIEKRNANNLANKITTELCSFTQLAGLKNRGPYDYIYSNFAGLNCTNQLDTVLLSLAPLVKPGGYISLVILPKFCLWETLLIFRGAYTTATRRFFSKNGRVANVEGAQFKCWYYNASFVQKTLKNHFTPIAHEGLCTLVPPSYISSFAEKHPGTFAVLTKLENKLKSKWPWRNVGDYYIITLRKL